MTRHTLVAVTLLITGCFGHAIERRDDGVLVENLGSNRYVFRSTALVHEPARGPATPVVVTPPVGARELGLIEVGVEYSGWGPGGLRYSEAAFFPRLAALAGEMGGTHFMIVRAFQETRMGGFITSLTASVLEAPPADAEISRR